MARIGHREPVPTWNRLKTITIPVESFLYWNRLEDLVSNPYRFQIQHAQVWISVAARRLLRCSRGAHKAAL